jgi:hypothetical protein
MSYIPIVVTYIDIDGHALYNEQLDTIVDETSKHYYRSRPKGRFGKLTFRGKD